MKLLTALTLAFTLVAPLAAAEGWITDAKAAQDKARAEQKLVLMNFTGSDWCGWCIKLKDEVFSTKQFKDYAAKNLVLLEVDFPRQKPQTAAQKQANQALQKKYGIRGYPTLIVLNGEGKQVGQLGYMPGGPKAFLGKLPASG
jgi:protein disulfide-isomerase